MYNPAVNKAISDNNIQAIRQILMELEKKENLQVLYLTAEELGFKKEPQSILETYLYDWGDQFENTSRHREEAFQKMKRMEEVGHWNNDPLFNLKDPPPVGTFCVKSRVSPINPFVYFQVESVSRQAFRINLREMDYTYFNNKGVLLCVYEKKEPCRKKACYSKKDMVWRVYENKLHFGLYF